MAKTVETREIVLTGEEFDKKFPIVRVSTLSLEDSFLEYEPEPEMPEILRIRIIIVKDLISLSIKEGLKDFRRPAGDLSFDENGNYIYKEGEQPAFGKAPEYAEKKLKEFMPEKNSRIGTLREYYGFLGILIKYLIEEQDYKVADAWHAVCIDSRALGHYWNSDNTNHNCENTGSRKVGEFYDLANVHKIVKDEKSSSGFSFVSGHAFDDSYTFTLSSRHLAIATDGVGRVPWCVMDV